MGERVRLKENGVLDEELPTLLENVYKYLSENLQVVCDVFGNDRLNLRDGIVIPNEICDR